MTQSATATRFRTEANWLIRTKPPGLMNDAGPVRTDGDAESSSTKLLDRELVYNPGWTVELSGFVARRVLNLNPTEL